MSQMNESMEKAAVKRFTVGYNKLCKNCPTRLQPRVDALTEMIMGLPSDDRELLLANVRKRIDEAENQAGDEREAMRSLKTPMEVYAFQVGTTVEQTETRMESNSDEYKNEKNQGGQAKQLVKCMAKMEKARNKLAESESRLARVSHLLDAVKLLLQSRSESQANALRLYDEDDEELDELRIMSRPQLKLQHLKYMSLKAKFERTRAKCRVKRYSESLKLAAVKKQLQEQQELEYSYHSK